MGFEPNNQKQVLNMADFSPLLGVISLLVAAGIPIALLLAYAGKLSEVLPFLKRFLPL